MKSCFFNSTVSGTTAIQLKWPEQAKPKEKVYTLSDGGGLQLRVKPNGSKLWMLDYYRPLTKVHTSLSFGNYPEASIADTREKRKSTRELLAKDIDPKEHLDE